MNAYPLIAEAPAQTIFIVADVCLLLVVFLVMLWIWASRYTKVGPDQALVVSGRKRMVTDPDGKVHAVGFRIVKGGGTFVFPVFEKAEALSLKPVSIDLDVANILTRDNGRAEVTARSQIRIVGDDLSLAKAAESLLGKTPEQVKEIASQILEGSLRSLVGKWTASELSQRQSEFAARWQEAVKEGLGDLGISVLSLSVKDLSLGNRVSSASAH
jgi:flotillin